MEEPPVLVYCHSQTGNRIEGLSLLEFCAQRSMSLLLFDFAGCGRSEGEYVSLGLFEAVDLDLIIRDLKVRFRVGTLCLWGRSMGAVTSIFYAENHQSEVIAMILDSPFSNLREMLIQIAQNKIKMPSVVISMALSLISGTVKQKIGIDLLDLEPGKVAEKCNIPALFIVAKDDEILPPKSVMDIYNRYKSSKKVLITSLEGGHAAEREDHIIEQAFSMLIDEISKAHYEQKMKEKITSTSLRQKSSFRMDDPFLKSTTILKQTSHNFGRKNSMVFESPRIQSPSRVFAAQGSMLSPIKNIATCDITKGESIERGRQRLEISLGTPSTHFTVSMANLTQKAKSINTNFKFLATENIHSKGQFLQSINTGLSKTLCHNFPSEQVFEENLEMSPSFSPPQSHQSYGHSPIVTNTSNTNLQQNIAPEQAGFFDHSPALLNYTQNVSPGLNSSYLEQQHYSPNQCLASNSSPQYISTTPRVFTPIQTAPQQENSYGLNYHTKVRPQMFTQKSSVLPPMSPNPKMGVKINRTRGGLDRSLLSSQLSDSSSHSNILHQPFNASGSRGK